MTDKKRLSVLDDDWEADFARSTAVDSLRAVMGGSRAVKAELERAGVV
jgi:hypothetical protein